MTSSSGPPLGRLRSPLDLALFMARTNWHTAQGAQHVWKQHRSPQLGLPPSRWLMRSAWPVVLDIQRLVVRGEPRRDLTYHKGQ
jgi:hypothetical protein